MFKTKEFRTGRKQMQRLIMAAMGGLFLLAPLPAQAMTMDDLINRWRSADYSGVLPQLVAYRTTPYGRNVQVDYMIATSLCRSGDAESLVLGQKFLHRILAAYELTAENRQQIKNEIASCMETGVTQKSPEVIAFAIGHADVGVRGKTFYWLDQQNGPLGGDPIQSLREIDKSELEARRFPPTQQRKAVARIRQLAGTGFQVLATEYFVIASASGQSAAELESIGRQLNAAMQFFHDDYGMPLPEYLITIYLTPSPHELRRLANRVHGLELGNESIGYSFRDDFSIAGVVSGPHSGTLKHELFHLMTRSHFGDILPWLDEGMAALYEVSRRDGERIDGLQNWRGDVLRRFWALRPDIATLVQMTWARFDAEGASREQQAANHAMARYFILFLQERGQLADLYRAFQQQQVASLSDDPRKDAIMLLQETLLQPIASLDQEFVAWFQSLNRPLSSEAMKRVQQILNHLGYNAGIEDGLLGQNTRQALKAFQKNEGLTRTGRLDTTTYELLKTRGETSGN